MAETITRCGACELQFGHLGRHARVPGGGVAANTWTDAEAAVQLEKDEATARAADAAAIWFSCPYCAERIHVTGDNVSRVVGESGVDDVTSFTVTFVTRHFRCHQ